MAMTDCTKGKHNPTVAKYFCHNMWHTSTKKSCNVSFPLGFLCVLQHVWQWLRFLTTDRTFTKYWNQPEGSSSSRPWHWQNTSMQWAENVPPPTSPHIPPRPGDPQPHPLPTSPQPASWAPSPCQETTNTNPFPEGRSQNQLLGVVFTNKAVLWGLRLRLGVESQQNVWCTPNIMASTLGNHSGNAGLQRGPFRIKPLLTFHHSCSKPVKQGKDS